MKLLAEWLLFYIALFSVISCAFFAWDFIDRKDYVAVNYPAELEAGILREEEKKEKVDVKEEEIYNEPFPDEIVSVYITSWSASRKDSIDYIIDLASTTEVNAVVIDIKDFSGYLAYDSNVTEVQEYGAEQIRIRDIEGLLDLLHENDIYVIARITVFQDPILAKARPDWAIGSKKDGLWYDNSGLAWIDPSSMGTWDYNIAIAKEALQLGFDEINFDYVRFPSDGDLKDMVFPIWEGEIKKRVIIEGFFEYLRSNLPKARLSVDLFGLSTVNEDDLGIGQVIEDSFLYFDFICPMVYPSHYALGYLGFEEPAKHPYKIVKRSLDEAKRRLDNSGSEAKLRPWLQDFDLRGVPYGEKEVSLEIKAVYDSLGEDYFGFMLWSPWNVYTKEALKQ